MTFYFIPSRGIMAEKFDLQTTSSEMFSTENKNLNMVWSLKYQNNCYLVTLHALTQKPMVDLAKQFELTFQQLERGLNQDQISAVYEKNGFERYQMYGTWDEVKNELRKDLNESNENRYALAYMFKDQNNLGVNGHFVVLKTKRNERGSYSWCIVDFQKLAGVKREYKNEKPPNSEGPYFLYRKKK
jgi:hypothetical protein